MQSFYYDFPSKEFILAFNSANKKLNDVGNGKLSGDEYLAVKQHLKEYANDKSGKMSLMPFSTILDILRVIAVLKQERNSSAQEDNDIFQKLIENEEKVIDVLENFNNPLIENNQNLITQKMLDLFYTRYKVFDDNKNKRFVEMFRALLFTSLQVYSGKIKRTLKAQSTPDIVKNNLSSVIRNYPLSTSLNDIQNDLCMHNDHEIWQKILIFKLIETVKSWSSNLEEDEVDNTLKEVITYKDVRVNESQNLIEQVVSIILVKCMQVNEINDYLLKWIFNNIGDPRNYNKRNIWFRIGKDVYHWLRAKLSQGDVREFLENMTDGHGDDIYQYRKKFWLQYVDYVKYAKIMLNKYEVKKLSQKNNDLFERFKKSPETYSRLDDSERSCIYIDFGEFKVIEGTHSAKVRFYKEEPIKLDKKIYEYDEFYSPKLKGLIIGEFTHSSSKNYRWQNKVRQLTNGLLGVKIPLKQFMLDEDIKYRYDEIQKRIFEANESIL